MFAAGSLVGLSSYHFLRSSAEAETNHYPLAGSVIQVAATMTADVGQPIPSALNFVSEVYKAIGPSVVNITTVHYGYDFFLRPVPLEGIGSGVIIDKEGYIITNNHVIADATRITVILADGTEVEGKVVGADPGTDLAVVKIEPPDGVVLHVATLGDSEKLRVGEWVVAVGNPLGLDQTVTVGVVSALGRSVMSKAGIPIRGLIQTDAAINPGNSGGPLINTSGEVIGINTAIISRSGGSEGIGLAIPINTAKSILTQLIEKGRVERPWLGIEVREIYPRYARRYGLPTDMGLLVEKAYHGSPAQKAGFHRPMRTDDGVPVYFIIVEANGQTITSKSQLLEIVRELPVDGTINIRYYRYKELFEKEVPLSPLPEEAPLTEII